jgi:hypothetical protein
MMLEEHGDRIRRNEELPGKPVVLTEAPGCPDPAPVAVPRLDESDG